MRSLEHEQQHARADAESPATSSSDAQSRTRFDDAGAVPDVGAGFSEPAPSASERAYDDIPNELVAIVAKGDEADLVQMLHAYPTLRSPILAAIGRAHGAPVAHRVGVKAAPTPDPTPATKTQAYPEGYDGGPIRVDPDHASDRQKVAGFDQIAAGVGREQAAPSHVRLPKSLVAELDRLWHDTVRKDKEHGGNVVRDGGSYDFRQTHDEDDNADTYHPDTDNLDGDRHVAIVHTHPTDTRSPDYVGFSDVDLAALVDESQPLNILRSGTQTYMVARTKEFEALIDKNNDPDQLSELRMAIHKTYNAAYQAAKAEDIGEPGRVEAGVIAVCRKFHLIYYWGQGQDLHRVR